MTPAARIAAAIDILDQIVAGTAAEQALTRWARQSRFAGSKDRAAVRDNVFEALRHWRSDAALGGGTDGQSRMIGRLKATGIDPTTLFTGEGHAPAPLTPDALQAGGSPTEGAEAFDVPDWLWSLLASDPLASAEELGRTWVERAPVSIRVNARHSSVADVHKALETQDISAEENPRAEYALTVSIGARRLRQTSEYLNGLFELQDASSQAVVDLLPEAKTVLDYCAGGGGKSLAMAARGMRVTAHDANLSRMRDLPARADRAGAVVEQVATTELEGRTFDIVLCDAPCSGSGAWRRNPEGKWALTQETLGDLVGLQGDILDAAADLVAPGGTLVYVTCSVLSCENEDVVDAFLKRAPAWNVSKKKRWPMDRLGDGFFTIHLTRE